MVELSLAERFKLVFNLIFSSPLFLVLLFAIAIMIIDSFVISKKSKKTKIAYLIISILGIIILLSNYFTPLLSVFDSIAKNIVTIIYFPSVLEYIIILLVTIGILIVSIINKKTNRRIKFINFIIFIIELFLFFLILDQINTNKIDLTNKISIYTNNNLMALFELSVIIFALWLIGLVIYKIIYKLNHKEIKENKDDNFYEEPELPKTIEELRKEELIPPPQIEYIVVEKKNDNDMFTLEEYRALKKLLETMKK